jgi:hypothetical protein
LCRVPTSKDSNLPILVPSETLDPFVLLASGSHHTCGLNNGGQVRCWSINATNPERPRVVPLPVLYAFVAFSTISAGHDLTCGLE